MLAYADVYSRMLTYVGPPAVAAGSSKAERWKLRTAAAGGGGGGGGGGEGEAADTAGPLPAAGAEGAVGKASKAERWKQRAAAAATPAASAAASGGGAAAAGGGGGGRGGAGVEGSGGREEGRQELADPAAVARLGLTQVLSLIALLVQKYKYQY